MSSTMDERTLFTHSYEGVEPAALWTAVKRVLATMDLRQADDGKRTARLSTGISSTSWGENMLASVTGSATEGTTLTVRGRPKGSFLTTKLGEDQHARTVEKQITKGVEAELRNTGKT